MPLNIDFQQIFLHLLNFTILLGGLYFLLYRPVKDFMAKRTAYYEDLDRQAKERLAEAERSQEAYRQKLDQADAEIRQKNEQAQQAALDAAREEAQAERERITGEARKEIPGMVAQAVEKLVLESTSAAYDQFLETVGEENGDV